MNVPKRVQDFYENETSIVVYEFEEQGLSGELASHEQFELVFIASGSGAWRVMGESGPFQAGTIVLLAPGVLHSWRSSSLEQGASNVSGIFLRFDVDTLSPGLLGMKELSIVSEMMERLESGLVFQSSEYDRIRSRMRSIVRSKGALRLARFLVLMELAFHSKLLKVIGVEGDERNSIGLDSVRFKAADGYIRSRFSERLRRHEVAREIGLEQASFSRFFRRASGTTFNDYLSRIRIQKAASLLTNRRSISIADVAKQCGFQNLSGFNRQFKRRIGMTPRDYRLTANLEPQQP